MYCRDDTSNGLLPQRRNGLQLKLMINQVLFDRELDVYTKCFGVPEENMWTMYDIGYFTRVNRNVMKITASGPQVSMSYADDTSAN